ncbi:MAG: hypothetical protein QOI41_758 [Myxococcales bacterium]|nr:hypothetical protein [Myxococcales bacterium]
MADRTKIATSGAEGPGNPPPRVGGALDGVNDGFHCAYDTARDEAKLDAPVFVVHADTLFVFRDGERREMALTPRIFHVIKSAAHAPVAIFAALHRNGNGHDGALAIPADGRVEMLREHVAAALASLDAEQEADRETRVAIREVLDASLAFLDRVLGDAPPTSSELDAFARVAGPQLLHLTTLATHVQLTALHEVVEKALAELDTQQRHGLQVVVTGDHQARVRSLGMQYFRKRFREPEGAEERVTYAEGVEDVDEALALVGTRRLDSAIAKAFFGDAKRLQRDVLGDAVHALLARTDLAPIR